MSSKTAAELQMEFLKKLKEQQKNGKAPKALPASARPGKKRAKAPGLSVSAASWKRLRDEFEKRGLNPRNKRYGDWAVELLLGLPTGSEALSQGQKEELFLRIRDWFESQGAK